MKTERLDYFHEKLSVILDHLREQRHHDAAAVINNVPDEEIRDFTYYLATHVERGLDWLRDEVKERVTAELKMADPYNPN